METDELFVIILDCSVPVSVTSLNLSSRSLTTINDYTRALSRLTALQYVTFPHNRLTSLPDGFCCGATALRELNLGDNQLTSLPGDFCRGATALQHLVLSFNRLTSLPDGFCQGATALQYLNLSINQLSPLPDGFCHGATALKKLYLDASQITSVPFSVYGLRCIDWTTTPWNLFNCDYAREWWRANRQWVMSDNRTAVLQWLCAQGQRPGDNTQIRTFFDAPWCCQDVCRLIVNLACSIPRMSIK